MQREQRPLADGIDERLRREQDQAEYIELYNKTGAPVSLAGWKLRGGVDYDFPAGTSVPANGYLIVGGNKAYLQSVYGGNPVGDWSGKLANKGEYINYFELIDPKLRSGGIIAADNITSHPEKVAPFVEKIKSDPNYQVEILDLPGGLLLGYKL